MCLRICIHLFPGGSKLSEMQKCLSLDSVCFRAVSISRNIFCKLEDGIVEWKIASPVSVWWGGKQCGTGHMSFCRQFFSSHFFSVMNILLFSGHEIHSLHFNSVHTYFFSMPEGMLSQLLLHSHKTFCFCLMPNQSLPVMEVQSFSQSEYFSSVLRITEFKG